MVSHCFEMVLESADYHERGNALLLIFSDPDSNLAMNTIIISCQHHQHELPIPKLLLQEAIFV